MWLWSRLCEACVVNVVVCVYVCWGGMKKVMEISRGLVALTGVVYLHNGYVLVPQGEHHQLRPSYQYSIYSYPRNSTCRFCLLLAFFFCPHEDSTNNSPPNTVFYSPLEGCCAVFISILCTVAPVALATGLLPLTDVGWFIASLVKNLVRSTYDAL